ncbi:MFS transporter [Marinimicrococcus flavescens]|uniref:MFS transporter n=1 Tax=Marinimicrococcus flavescens TaxID=3031815 RepID=A0AAP3XSE0_9PROT|nr:MFS transporter [Marinimicrococcus flavescens]
MQATARGLRAIPKGIWALGAVSFLMDASSELIHGLLPVFLVVTLGASPVALGLIEGIAEATASIVKLFSGALSDRLGKRKLLAVAGYGLAALSKPLFPLASSVGLVLAARFIDRIGKGIRGAPRDALVADLAPPGLRGACFGLRQSLDTAGAVLGPLAAVALMALLAGDIRLVLWFAVIPAVLAVAVLLLAVEEPAHAAGPARGAPLRWREAMALGPACWKVVAVGAVMSLARFSEAFLILRAQQQGLAMTLAPLVLALMSVVYAASAYPAGALADRIDRWRLLMAALTVLVLADLLLAAGGLVPAMAGVALWGLHMGLSQGLLAALVADTAPPALRGTAFGVFNLASGLVLLLASLLAGLFWEVLGAPATFLAGALFAGLAALLLVRWSGTGAGP